MRACLNAPRLVSLPRRRKVQPVLMGVLVLFFLCAVLPSAPAETIASPIAKVTSGTILKTEAGELLVLYGIEAPRVGTEAAQTAKEFTAERVLGKDITIEVYARKSGLTFVKVTLLGDKDLSELLLQEGLATWDTSMWRELPKLGELEELGRKVAARREAEAKEARDAEQSAAAERLREQELARDQARRKKNWDREVRRWSEYSPVVRQAARMSLDAMRKTLEPKMARARKLYSIVTGMDEILHRDASVRANIEQAYAIYKDHFGPRISAEFGLREWDDARAEAEGQFDTLVAELNRLNAELSVHYPAYQAAVERITALDDALPEDIRVAEAQGARFAWAGRDAPRSSGTGFVFAKGHVMTCAHVTRGATTIRVRTRDGKMHPAAVVAEDADGDWAVLEAEEVTAEPIPIANRTPDVGSPVYTLGYPLGSVMESKDPVAGSGNVAALQGIRGDKRHLQVTVPMNEGASGSPIMNDRGEWVGLASHKISDLAALKAMGSVPQGLNFAVKAQHIQPNVSPKVKVTLAKGGSNRTMTLRDVVRRYSSAVVWVVVERM